MRSIVSLYRPLSLSASRLAASLTSTTTNTQTIKRFATRGASRRNTIEYEEEDDENILNEEDRKLMEEVEEFESEFDVKVRVEGKNNEFVVYNEHDDTVSIVGPDGTVQAVRTMEEHKLEQTRQLYTDSFDRAERDFYNLADENDEQFEKPPISPPYPPRTQIQIPFNQHILQQIKPGKRTKPSEYEVSRKVFREKLHLIRKQYHAEYIAARDAQREQLRAEHAAIVERQKIKAVQHAERKAARAAETQAKIAEFEAQREISRHEKRKNRLKKQFQRRAELVFMANQMLMERDSTWLTDPNAVKASLFEDRLITLPGWFPDHTNLIAERPADESAAADADAAVKKSNDELSQLMEEFGVDDKFPLGMEEFDDEDFETPDSELTFGDSKEQVEATVEAAKANAAAEVDEDEDLLSEEEKALLAAEDEADARADAEAEARERAALEDPEAEQDNKPKKPSDEFVYSDAEERAHASRAN